MFYVQNNKSQSLITKFIITYNNLLEWKIKYICKGKLRLKWALINPEYIKNSLFVWGDFGSIINHVKFSKYLKAKINDHYKFSNILILIRNIRLL